MNPFEFINLATDAIKSNKLRSILTLLGIAIGVFSIIAVMTAVSVLQNSIEGGLSQLGTNTFQIQKYPAGINSNRRDFRNRPDITYDQAVFVKERATLPKHIGIEAWNWGDILKSDYDQIKGGVASIAGGDYAFFPNNNYDFDLGRSINEDDIRFDRPVMVIGKDIADKLFPNMNPIGQEIVLKGYRFTVIGLLKSAGSSFGQSQDNIVIMPITRFFRIYGWVGHDLHLTVMAPDAETYEATVDEIFSLMRISRRLDFGDPNDFEIFSNDSLIEGFNDFTAVFKIAAAVISFIALLAAGIGIMNIMLVSVTERTKEIGIRKAVGATKNSILFQFVSEATILSQFGGLFGIATGAIVGNLVALLIGEDLVFPWVWAFIGITVCSFVGLVFGSYPAYKAANLDPIESLRYE